MSGIWKEQVGSALVSEISPGPPTEYVENFTAFINNQLLSNNSESREVFLSDMYANRVQEIYRETGQRLVNPVVETFEKGTGLPQFPPPRWNLENEIDDFEKQADTLREQYPNLTTRENMWQEMAEISGVVDAESAGISERATIPGKIGGFMGTMVGAMMDPINLITLPLGAPASAGILRTVLIEAAVGAGAESAVQFGVQDFRGELGLESGFVPALKNIAFAAGGQAVLAGGIKTVGKVIKSDAAKQLIDQTRDQMQTIQEMSGRKLVNLFDRNVKFPSPEQKVARDMTERLAEIDEENPFDMNAPGAADAHHERMNAAMKSLADDTLLDLPEDAPPLSKKMLEAEAERLAQEEPFIPGLLDDVEPKENLALFDEPDGEGARLQAQTLESDIRNQPDILEQHVPVGERVDEKGNVVSETRTVREMLDEIDIDARDMEALRMCGVP